MREILARAADALASAGVDGPRAQAERLLAHVLGTNRGGLLARARTPLSAPEKDRFEALVRRRAAREPLQHLLGSWPFLELELKVDRRALIPRPETEDLARRARARLPVDAAGACRVADIGTGTGCLALALARSHPRASVVGVDASAEALALADENRTLLCARGQVALVLGDLLGPLRGPFELVLANLPYVTEEEFPGLEPEVRVFDPRSALVAPDGGLALVRRLCRDAPRVLAPGGWLLLEVAPGQTAIVADLLRDLGYRDVAVVNDHLGRPRIVEARR